MKMLSWRYEKYAMPVVAEFFGQSWFAFMHCMSANTVGITDSVKNNPIIPAMTDGIFVVVIVLSIGHISGGHVNAAISTVALLSGGLKPILFPFYIVAQLCGSIAGASLALVVNGEASGAFKLGTKVSVGKGLLCEVLLTSLVMFVVIMTAIDQESKTAAFAIGLAVMIDIYAGFSITGGCMNPTLSFGPAMVSGKWDNYWLYWIGPLLGSLLAVLVHRTMLGSRQKRLLFRAEGEEQENLLPATNSYGGFDSNV